MNISWNTSWTPQEAASVNEFLSTPVGQRWLFVLYSRKPRLNLDSTERAALTGAQIAGYEACLSVMDATRMAIQTDPASAKAINPAID
jgi:hypothetical protein